MEADPSKLDLLVIQIDGIHIEQNLILLAAAFSVAPSMTVAEWLGDGVASRTRKAEMQRRKLGKMVSCFSLCTVMNS